MSNQFNFVAEKESWRIMVRGVLLRMPYDVSTHKQTYARKVPLSMEMVRVDSKVCHFLIFLIFWFMIFYDFINFLLYVFNVLYSIFVLLTMTVYIEPSTTSTKLCFNTPLRLHWWIMHILSLWFCTYKRYCWRWLR